jgi:hypothetical protein
MLHRGYPRRVSKAPALVVAGLVVTLTIPVGPMARPDGVASVARSVSTVRVKGNRLVNGSGRTIRLLGVDRSGTEYACVQGWDIFDGPSSATSIAAIRAWHVNAVRVPLNEDCWLGINGVKESLAGAAYRRAIKHYVKALNAAGLVAVLDLHWSAPGAEPATGQQVMADARHSVAFWSSVARTFRSNSSVLFDLYNEPHDISWSCWRNGCTTASGWKTAGMQQLLDADPDEAGAGLVQRSGQAEGLGIVEKDDVARPHELEQGADLGRQRPQVDIMLCVAEPSAVAGPVMQHVVDPLRHDEELVVPVYDRQRVSMPAPRR